MVARLNLIVFSSVLVLCSAKLPQFSWDTVPVFFHSGNESGLYSQDALQTIAKFPMVTIEKFQSYKVQGVDDEDDMIAVMKAVKKINPDVATYFYMDSFKDRPQLTKISREFSKHPDWYLTDDNGTKVKLNYYAFDETNPAVRQWWLETCLNFIKLANGDGCFCDASQNVNVTFTPPLSAEKEKLWREGLLNLTKEVQDALDKNDNLLIGKRPSQPYVKAVQIEYFRANNDSINYLMLGVSSGQVTQAHVPVTQPCTEDLTNYLAAFLIGAGKYSYFGCGIWGTEGNNTSALIWRPEYDKPLGDPLGPPIYSKGVWKRKFSKGTEVEFDTASNTGKIQWGAM